VIAAELSGELVIGALLGFLLGVLVGPLMRSWLAWREWASASREADLIEDVLERMDADAWPSLEDREAEDASHLGRRPDAP
jgi:hypothetical protein